MAAADLEVVEMVVGLGVAEMEDLGVEEAAVDSVVAADPLEMKVLLLKLLVSYPNSFTYLFLCVCAYHCVNQLFLYIQRSLHLFTHAKEML